MRAWCDFEAAELADIARDEGVGSAKRLDDRADGARSAELLEAHKPNADGVVVVPMDCLG